MTDQVVEIDRKDWIDLRNLYLKDWPNNMVGYYTINNFISWFQQDPDIKNVHIYSLNNDWTDGTFVVIHRYQLFLNTIGSSNERLFKLLQLIDWSRGLAASTFLERHREVVLRTVEAKKLDKVYDGLTLLYYLPREEAAKLEVNIPKGIALGPLNDTHAQTADNVWPHRHTGSLHLLKMLRRLNPHVGVFTAEGKLISWSYRLQAGPLGALQVDNDYRGQGFGSLVCRVITRKLGEAGEDVFACILEENTASRKMFERCGFAIVDKAYWLATRPTVPFEWKEEFE